MSALLDTYMDSEPMSALPEKLSGPMCAILENFYGTMSPREIIWANDRPPMENLANERPPRDIIWPMRADG